MPDLDKKVKTPRIIALDLLRGYFLVSIILNHLQWYPNAFDWVALRGSLFVSAAEGFFIISGILLGIVRGRSLIDKPLRVSAALVLKRGFKLYATTVILMLIFTFIGWLFLDNPGLKPGIRPTDQPLHEILLGALQLQYLYGWADFLRLYALFLIITPVALWLLRKGKWYIVAAISIASWAWFPIVRTTSDKSAELLMPLSWQLIFFAGLIIGFHWVDLQAWWERKRHKTKQLIGIPVLSTAIITLTINAILVVAIALGAVPEAARILYDTNLATTFSKEALTIPRLILFGLWFTLGLYVFIRYEKKITQWFGWILLPFGMNSLYVYILHAILIFFAHLLIAPGTSHNIVINFIGSVLILAIILFATRKRFLFRIIPR